MKPALRILLLEDNAADAELVLEALSDEDFIYEALRVETEAAFLAALDQHRFDLVLSDYSLPSFDGFSALKIVREKLPSVPFIFVSGTLGEELAIETLKNGATDYVLKHRLVRLGSAIRRAIAEAEERTARQGAEKARAQAESLFRALFDQVAIGVAIANLEGRIVKANPALQVMLGYSESECREITLARLTYPDDADVERSAYEELCAVGRGSYQLEKRYVRKDGTVIWGRVVVSLIREGGSPHFSIHLIEDITERKSLEEQFRQSQKLEAVGRLAGGVAHDFNNALTIITGYGQLLLQQLEVGNPLRSYVGKIQDAAGQAAGLTRQLLTFSRRRIVQPEIVDLNAVINNLNKMMQPLISADTELRTKLDPALGRVRVDAGQMDQVLMNLIVNARDAMPGGGRVTVETANVDLELTSLRPGSETKPGPHVMIAVSDTGCGMDPQTQSRIFEPFFTTKEGKGTGLGLSTVHGIVCQAGGHIEVRSEPGQGSTFRLYLPRVDAELPEIRSSQTAGEAPRGTETILVVEDGLTLRELIREALEPYGYQVMEAGDGEEALAICQAYSRKIDLVVTDLLMPRMSGREVAKRARKLHPEAKILYISGYAGDTLVDDDALGAAEPLLQKPFTPNALLEKVREVLEVLPISASILITDDDADTRSLLRVILEKGGYTVLEAENGNEALAVLKKVAVKLVITDLVMPEREGLDTIRQIRENHVDVKIIAISGAFSGTFLTVAGQLGADAVLEKPLQVSDVLNLVRKLLDESSRRDVQSPISYGHLNRD